MKESSNSQIIEQVVRIIFVLGGSYFVIKILQKDIKLGVAVALLGAFFGGLAAYIYLKAKYNKQKKLEKEVNENEKVLDNKTVTKLFIIYSIPSIILSLASSIYDLADQVIVLRGAYNLGFSAADSEVISSIIATWGVKICMLITAVGTALAINVIPHLASSFVKKDMKEVNNKFNQILTTGLFMGLPLTIGVSILAKPLYQLFYDGNIFGPKILAVVVFAVLLANISSILNTALISINEHKIIYINNIFGIVLNLILDYPLMVLFNKLNLFPIWGASFSSILSFSLSIVVALLMLKKKYKFTYHKLIKDYFKISLSGIIMAIPLVLLNKIFTFNYGNLNNFIIMIIYAIIGAIIYILINYKNNIINEVIEKENINKILIKLHLKKGVE